MPELPLENYFGDGRDGVLDTTGNVTFPVAVDGPTVYKYYTSMRINAGHTVTPQNRCKGMVIYCLGDCVINGTLSMLGKGSTGPETVFAPNNLDKILTYTGHEDFSIKKSTCGASRTGPSPGTSTTLAGNAGNAGSGVAGSGGGGSGACWRSFDACKGGNGSAGNIWGGGAGGGGGALWSGLDASGIAGGSGQATFGNGWNGSTSAGGGAGSPAGLGRWADGGGASKNMAYPAGNGGIGVGGLLILIVRGSLTIDGKITTEGVSGGAAAICGGGSGGGGLLILYGDSYLKSQTGVVTTAGGSGRSNGGRGGNGSLKIAKIKAAEISRSFRPIVIDQDGHMTELPKFTKMDASVGVWFGEKPLDTDKYPFYYNLSEQMLYFFADENGDGVGDYIPMAVSDQTKMDKDIYDPSSYGQPMAFADQLHFHRDVNLLEAVNETLLSAIHSHNNFIGLESLTEERLSTLDKLGEYEGQPTWNSLAWPVGNPASVGAAMWISSTPPADPNNYPFWWNTSELCLYVYHIDGDSGQYVEANPIRHGKDGVDGLDGHDGRDGIDGAPGRDGLNGLDGANRLWVGSDIPANPVSYPFWWNPIEGRFLIWYETDSCYVEANPVVHGVDGQDGVNGTNGVDGQDGADGLDGDNKIWVGTEIPSNPETYPFWWNPVEGRLLIWYTTANAYVEANPVVHGIDGQDGVNGIGGIDGKDGKDGLDGANRLWTQPDAPANPTTYPFWWNPDDGRLRIYYEDGDSGQYVDANPVVHGVDGRDGIDGVDGAPGADGAPGGIQSFPTGYYIRKAELLVDTAGYSATTSWKLGPSWSPIYDFLPNSKIWFSIKVPARNDSSNWGGMFLELQIRFNSGAWYSLGCTGFDTIMEFGQSVHSYNCDYLVQGPDVPFSVEIRTYFKSYDGTTTIVTSNAVNSLSGTAPLIEPAIYSKQHYSKLIVKELALFPIV